MSTSRTPSTSLNSDAREYFWGCTLNEANPTVEWNFLEEEEDMDYMNHTLFLRHAVLGEGAKEGEVNIVTLETEMYQSKPITQPILSLIAGKSTMCYLDLSFDHLRPVKFTLLPGCSGPVSLSGQHLVDYPEERIPAESTMEDTATEEDCDELETAEDARISKKRKATPSANPKSKRGKVSDKVKNGDEEEMDDDDDDDEEVEEVIDEDEDDEEEESEDEEEEDTPEKPIKKGAKSKAKPTKSTNGSAVVTKKAKGKKEVTPKKSKKGKAK